MSLRPLTIGLIVLLSLVGASSVLYYTGALDPYFAEQDAGPVAESGSAVRNPVSDIVLPLSSSQKVGAVAGESPAAEDVVAEDESVAAESPEKESLGGNHPIKLSDVKKIASVAVTDIPKKSADKKISIEEKVSEKQAPVTKPAGKVRSLKVDCAVESVALKVILSQKADKITWFNISNPRKLVIDIHGNWKNYAKSIYRLKDCSIDKIILGEQSDRLRLVFYIDKKNVAARIKPVIKNVPDGVELKIKL